MKFLLNKVNITELYMLYVDICCRKVSDVNKYYNNKKLHPLSFTNAHCNIFLNKYKELTFCNSTLPKY